MHSTRDDHANHAGTPQGGPMDPDAASKTAGSNTQSQGGVSHRVAQQAKEDFDPATGIPNGPLGRQAEPTKVSIEGGGGEQPNDGWAHHGFRGDDGKHRPTDSTGTGVSRQPGQVADLGPQQDQRIHGVPQDPAERTTGGDSPNQGGTAGSPGGPRKTTRHIPGQDADEGVTGGPSGNDTQRDPQI